jgi:hypothetical protein
VGPDGAVGGGGGRSAPIQAVPRCPVMDLTYTCDGPGVYLAGLLRRRCEVKYERHLHRRSHPGRWRVGSVRR